MHLSLTKISALGIPVRVTDMNEMFRYADTFNQDIGTKYRKADRTLTDDQTAGVNGTGYSYTSWDTSAVTNMHSMFLGATAFNRNIGSWDTGAVTDMYRMFQNATAFNQPIGSWDTGVVKTMQSMFHGASAFNQDISSWNISSILAIIDFPSSGAGMRNMFDGCNKLEH